MFLPVVVSKIFSLSLVFSVTKLRLGADQIRLFHLSYGGNMFSPTTWSRSKFLNGSE